ncbi:MAG TPA: response regulator transcription factor [Rhodocyclaceae bacterium]|nr:response regulator transcription factor [Rhodocyclaceae bacterium]
MIRIVIADDHGMMRAGLKQIVASTNDIVVVGEATQGNEVLDLVRTIEFDVLLLDLNMPGPSGVDLIMRVRQEKPALPILVLSMHNEGQFVSRSLKAGASGYVTKDSEPGILISAVRKLSTGDRFIDPSLVNQLVFEPMARIEQPHLTLSNREYQVLQMFVQGKTVTQMAKALQLSAKTVSTHKSHIKEKLGIQGDADLIRYAIDHRL